MKKELAVAIIVSLVIGFGGGYLVAKSNASDSSDNDKTGHSHTDSSTERKHGHNIYDVPSENAPTVSMSVEEDEMSGWNISLDTTNFTFAPENVNQENVRGEGHAHLYVDGKKVARLYGPSFHYDGNFDGTKTFRVTLNANDHSEYAIDGRVIEATEQVTHHPHE